MPTRLILGGAIAVTIASVAISWIQYAGSRGDYAAEVSRLDRLAEDVRSLEQLRASRAHAQESAPLEEDLLGAVRNTIRRAGLRENTFRGLSTSGSEAIRGRAGFHRTTYRLELTSIDAVDLGAFLSIWEESQPLWAVSRIELRHEAQANRRSRAGGTPGYAVSMTLETVFAAGSAEQR